MENCKIYILHKMQLIAGIGMVHQHFMLVPSQTVTENILLGLNEPTFYYEISRIMIEKIQEMGERLGLKVDPRAENLAINRW